MDKSDFLEDMANDKYIDQKEIDERQDNEDKIQDKIDKKQNKIDNKISEAQKLELKQQKLQEKIEEKQIEIENESTEKVSKTKRQLSTKINKYKKLFKNELSDYKIKKGSTEAELKEHIINIQDLLDSSEIDTYINDSIYATLKMIEPYTTNSRYDIRGLSDMLKLNQNFDMMVKKLMLKYNCFNSTPIEYQMIIIINTSVYITIQNNNSRPALNEYLNQKI